MIFKSQGHSIEFNTGSSTGYPGYKGMQTSDIRLWFRVDNGEWKRSSIHSQLKASNQFEAVSNEEEFLILIDILEDKL